MAVETKYGNLFVFTSAGSQMLDTADGEARVFGHIDNTSAGANAIDYLIQVEVPVGTAVVTGDTYSIYIIESADDQTWTDNMSMPNAEADQVDKLKDAKLAAVVDAFHASAQPVTTVATFHVGQILPTIPPYTGFVFKNDTSGTIPPGTSAYAVPITVSAS